MTALIDLASACPEWCDQTMQDHWMFGDGHMECSEGEFLAGSCRRGSGCPDCRVSGSLMIGTGRAIARRDMRAQLPQGTPSGIIVPAVIRVGDPYIYVHMYGCDVDKDAALTIQQARYLAARLVEMADSLDPQSRNVSDSGR